jgi:hypothetical protein
MILLRFRRQNRKRRKLSKHIPDDKYYLGCRDAEVVDLADMRHEYTLVSSRLELIKRQPELLAASREFFPVCKVLAIKIFQNTSSRAHR